MGFDPTQNRVQIDQWDETMRGKKMSSADGRVIFKYQMPVLERFTMKMPKGAEIIIGLTPTADKEPKT